MAYLYALFEYDLQPLGDNAYKIPHMNKSKMEQKGTLPMVLQVTDAAEPLMEMMEMKNLMDKVDMDEEEEDSEKYKPIAKK